jgi:D-aspartate ligase
VTRAAIVAGASYRALEVVRSLGRHGVRVIVLRTDDHSLAGHSRFAERTLMWPRGDDAERRDELLRLVEVNGLRGSVLITTDDEDAATVGREHAALSDHLVVTGSPWRLLEAAYDKRAMHRFASEIRMPQPTTVFPTGEADLEKVDSYPAVVKPAFKAQPNALTAAKAWRADDRRTLVALYRRACELMEPQTLMVQQLVPGDGHFSFAALCDDGRVLASVTARRTRQYPLDFGRASTFVETINDPTVARDGRRFLAALRLDGIVEVEFKRDPKTHSNLLLDVNARAWGWQSLGATAGVDFPYLLWRSACGLPVSEAHARPGVGWMRMLTDIPAVASSLQARQLTLRDYLRSFRRPLAHATFAADDPLPGLIDPMLLGSIFVSRLRYDRAA